ncbi:hypothetical protein [Prosthecomicrobium sp. N25]|uniref:hypothetical protein n=1 Tax=Prosthecomicrobium sp. N25 TaxID=3129254 RepID=UPI0030770C7C
MIALPVRVPLRRLARRLAPAAALALALLGPAGPAAAQSAEDIVRSWLDAMRAGGATVETGVVNYNRRNDILEVRDLRIVPKPAPGKPGGSIRVPSLGFIGLTRPADGGLQAKSMRVTSVEGMADDGTLRFAVAGIEAANVALPNFADFVIDPARPFTSQIRILKGLAAVRADSMTVGRVTLDVRAPEASVNLTYEGLTLTGMAGGRVDRIQSGPMLINSTSPQDGQAVPVEIRIGKGEVVGYDLGAYVRVMDGDAYAGGRGDGVWRDLQKSATVENISIAAGPGRFTLARASMGAVRMRQLDEPIGEIFDRIIRDPKALEADEKLAARFGFGILRAMAIEHYTLDGWSLAGPDLDRFQLGRFTVRDLSADGLGEVSFDGLDAAAQGNAVRFARFAFGGLRFPDYRNFERAIEAGKSGVDFDPTSVIPTLGFVKLDGVLIEAAGKGSLGLGGFSLDLGNYVKAIPTSLRMKLANVVIPTALAEDPKARELFDALGYKTLDLSSDVVVRWDEGAGELKVETVSASLADGGTLAFDAALGNVPRALFENPENAQQYAVGMTVKGLGLAYRDASLAERLLKFAAREAKQPPETLRQQAIAAVPALLKDIRDPGLRQKAIDAITAFLRAPRSLTIVTRLPRPLPVTQIVGSAVTGPQQLPNILQLDVTANQ